MGLNAFNEGAGGVAGIFVDLTALQAASVPNGRKVELITGEKFQVEVANGGNGVLLASGNFANPTYFGVSAINVDEVAPNNSISINALGDVGVGTETPDTLLHTSLGSAGAVTARTETIATFESDTSTFISILVPDNNASGIFFGTNLNNDKASLTYNSGNSNSMQFRVNNLTDPSISINSLGDIGVGTETPDTLLHTSLGSAGVVTPRIETIATFESDTSTFINMLVPDNNASGIFFGTNLNNDKASLTYNTGNSNSMQFRVNNISNSSISINALGDVGVGTETPISTLDIDKSTDTLALRVDRSTTNVNNPIVEFISDVTSANSTHCQILSDGDIENTNNSYGAISDEKLKENILDCTSKLDDIMLIQIRNFNIKGDPNKQIGVIAQELEQIFPSIIKNHDDYEMIPDPDWVPRLERIEERQMFEEIISVSSNESIVLEGGKYIEKTIDESITEKTLLWDEFPLYNGDGIQIKNKTHRTPRMEIIKIPGETENDRPFIKVNSGTVTKSVKYSILLPIVIKALQELKTQVDNLQV